MRDAEAENEKRKETNLTTNICQRFAAFKESQEHGEKCRVKPVKCERLWVRCGNTRKV